MDDLHLVLILFYTLTYYQSVTLSTGELKSVDVLTKVGQSNEGRDNVIYQFGQKLNCTGYNCTQCLQLLNITGDLNSNGSLTSPPLIQISVALIYYTLNIGSLCTENYECQRSNYSRHQCFLKNIEQFIKTNHSDEFIKTLKKGVKNSECVDFTESIVIPTILTRENLENISVQLVNEILRAGDCSNSSLPGESHQYNKIIELEKFVLNTYGVNDKIPLLEFQNLLEALNLGDEHEKNHNEHDHDHHNERDPDHNNVHEHDHHNEQNHNHKIDSQSEGTTNNSFHSKSLRKRRHTVKELENQISEQSQCYNATHLFDLYTIDPHEGATQQQLQQLCPVLLQQIITNACQRSDDEVKNSTTTSNSEKYGYGTIAVAVISLFSLFGIFIFPYMSKSVYETLITAFIALGVGTLTGDALLHLIPECLGTHSHTDEVSGELSASTRYSLVILAAIYLLFIFESIMDMLSRKFNPRISDVHDQGHGHSHIPDLRSVRQGMTKTNEDGMEMAIVASPSTISLDQSQTSLVPAKKGCCKGMTSLALVIILGDAIHNVSDGLAIGAAFSSDISKGLSTSIAILCHEIPHELADFAVLLSTGMSMKVAACYNLVSACTAFIGLYIGCAVGDDENARKWIFAVAAGMFLYVALGDLMMELIHPRNGFKWKSFLSQNIGMLIGIGIMLLIAVYEDQIKIII